jgi:hypothetical protein
MKILTADNRKVTFSRIEKSDSVYYGLKKHDGQIIRILLHQKNIQSVRPVNKVASTVFTIAGIVVPTGIIAVLFITSDYSY